MNKSLKNAVRRQLEVDDHNELVETLREVREHGAACGFHGFIYYHETCAFFDENRKEILALVSELSLDEEIHPAQFVSRMPYLNGYFLPREIECLLLGAEIEDGAMVKNAMAWLVLECAAYEMEVEA